MSNAFYKVPVAVNEPVKSYAPGSPETSSLIAKYNEMYSKGEIDIPMYIGGEEIRTKEKRPMSPPHDHKKILGYSNVGDSSHVEMAIEKALEAKSKWANLPWEQRAAIFLRAAISS